MMKFLCGVLFSRGEEEMLQKFVLASTVSAGALLLGATVATASPINILGTFHFLDHRSANSINLGAGLFQTFGAEAASANDAATVGTATQTTSSDTYGPYALHYEPFDTNPHHFVASRPASQVPNGPWSLSFSNGTDIATATTLGITTSPPLIPFATAMSISGAGTSTPTLSWTAPGGTPGTFDAQRLIIRDTTQLIGNGGVGGSGIANIIYSQDIGKNTTSVTLSPGDFTQALAYGHLYSAELLVSDLRNTSNPNTLANTLSLSRTFADFTLLPASAPNTVYLPAVDTSDPSQTVYQFNQVPISTTQPTYIDPIVAIGYDYQIGMDDPNFASVALPTGIGDNSFQLYLWDNSQWVYSQDLTGGTPFDFTSLDPNGLDRFRILGIETSALLDPNSSTAFITGLTFMPGGSGTFSGTMTPITAETPIPATLPLFASGIGGLGYLTWRRRKRAAKAPA
jgi:hypothetical protein